ncbi:unnamed protein product [Allacma fusca]|uniref:Uncharacterized protein n=1 Tax=Allacma fusca TaxID=39272 RepID=A0A8J2NNG7_9HEXA|nr:unnamed protein product [Allacma fusca]
MEVSLRRRSSRFVPSFVEQKNRDMELTFGLTNLSGIRTLLLSQLVLTFPCIFDTDKDDKGLGPQIKFKPDFRGLPTV